MATTVIDSYITRSSLDARDYLLNSRRQVAATNEMAKAQQRLQSANRGGGAGGLGGGGLSALANGFKLASGGASGLASALGPIAAVAAVAAFGVDKLIEAGRALYDALEGPARTAAEFDALVSALSAVEGSSKAAAKSLKDLKQIASAPGLGLEESISGYTQLRNSGLSADFSKRLIRELGNANAKAGGGPDKLQNILAQISQAASKPFLQGEELSTLTENGIPAYKLVRELFGTTDTEELKKNGVTAIQVLDAITDSLEKSARVAGSSKNSFDNLADAVKLAQVDFGRGINEAATPLADTLTDVLALATDSGVFANLADDIKNALNVDDANIKEVFIGIVASAKTAIQLLGALKDNFKAVLSPVAGFLIDQAFSGLAGAQVGELYAINDKATRDAMGAATVRRGIETDRAKIAAKNPKEKGPLVDDPSMLAVVAKNTKDTADQTRRLADTLINKQSAGGGALAKDAISTVNVSSAISGVSAEWAPVVAAISTAVEKIIQSNLLGERRFGRQTGGN